jgi:hypothetical protein
LRVYGIAALQTDEKLASGMGDGPLKNRGKFGGIGSSKIACQPEKGIIGADAKSVIEVAESNVHDGHISILHPGQMGSEEKEN